MFRGLLTATVLQPVKRAARLPSPRLRPAVWQELGDRQEGAGAWANLGTVYLDQGDLNRAEQEQAKYLRMARDLGDRDSECRALGNLGNVERARGQYEAAAKHYREALNLARELGNPVYESMALGGIANVHAHLGDTEEARGLYEQQLQISRITKDRFVEAFAHNNLATLLLREEGDSKEVLQHTDTALRNFRRIGYPKGEADALWYTGLALADMGKPDAARERSRQALSIFKNIGSPKAREVEEQLHSWREEDPS